MVTKGILLALLFSTGCAGGEADEASNAKADHRTHQENSAAKESDSDVQIKPTEVSDADAEDLSQVDASSDIADPDNQTEGGFSLTNQVSLSFRNTSSEDVYVAVGASTRVGSLVSPHTKGFQLVTKGTSIGFNFANDDSFGTTFYVHGRNKAGTKVWGTTGVTMCVSTGASFDWNSLVVNAGCSTGKQGRAFKSGLLRGNMSGSFTFTN